MTTSDSAPDAAHLSIDIDRLRDRISELGAIGEVLGPNGERGCCRLALTDADREGRNLVVTWMRDLGLDVIIDQIGNVFATLPGTDPNAAPVMTGSHIDTVATGGRFDGNLGVLAGIEVIETLVESRTLLKRPVTVAFFTNEEGARFAPDMLGSLVHVGGMTVEEARDVRAVDGAVLGEELDRIGYAGPTPCPAVQPAAFFELHIEQGPVLERKQIEIGVVEGVQGISWTEWTFAGRSAHAGTTPLEMRQDPAVAAGALIGAVRSVAESVGNGQVGTVGRVELTPNLVNVVPSVAKLTVDLRNPDEATLQQAEAQLAAHAERVASEQGVEVSSRSLARFEPVAFDATQVSVVERAAAGRGYSNVRMPSGAGHDAQMLARTCPTAMIFIPSKDGLSHNVAEYSSDADIERGANVLLDCIVDAASA